MRPTVLFSKRMDMAQRAQKWMRERGVMMCPLNTVTALVALGIIKKYVPAKPHNSDCNSND